MNQPNKTTYPVILEEDHISEILRISKLIVHEIMNTPEFPLNRIGERLKRVRREAFLAGKKIKPKMDT